MADCLYKIVNKLAALQGVKGNVKKKWLITTTYEPNRLASHHLADTYEKIFPKNKYQVSANKNKEIGNRSDSHPKTHKSYGMYGDFLPQFSHRKVRP